MDDTKKTAANEPVDVAEDDEFMDTGVLHERKTPAKKAEGEK